MTTFITDHDGKACPNCGDTMCGNKSNLLPTWSDYYLCDKCGTEVPNGSGHYPNGDTGDRVCGECADDKQYLIWNADDDYYIVRRLPEGAKLTTQGDGTVDFIVDVSHWDSADLFKFDMAEEGDKVAQLEGLVEQQTTLTECSHPIETWEHHFDPTTTLGDYYTCGVCGELTQVG